MKITRNVMGHEIEIELTADEILKAATEYEYHDDESRIVEALREYEDINYEVDDIPYELLCQMGTVFRQKMNAIAEDKRGDMIDSTISEFEGRLADYAQKDKAFSKRVTMTVSVEYTIRAQDEEEAEEIFERWSENHADRIYNDACDAARYDAEWDYDFIEEEPDFDPENADIYEE